MNNKSSISYTVRCATARLLSGLARQIDGKLPVRTSRQYYNFDGLSTCHNHAFMDKDDFKAAYARGVSAAGSDYGWYWRVHVGLWAARHAAHLSGDFVECGVNRGFMSSAIMHDLNWNERGKTFWLLDTFEGLDEEQASLTERSRSDENLRSGFYIRGVDSVKANFAQWPTTRVIQGAVPGTLGEVTSDQIAFLSLDMNHAPPEVAALEHFWPRLTPGAIVLADDFGYAGYEAQHFALADVASRLGVYFATLPTGQGLLIKPPNV